MDPTLQKRLIGAFILIVAAIVFVPMLLDGPGPAGTETVDLGIPSPGADGMRTEVVPLDAPLPAPRVADEFVAAPPAMVDETLTAADPQAFEQVAPDAIPADAEPPLAELPAAVEPVPTVAVDSQHAADGSGRWHVTLGSYANSDNARKLVAEMRRAGFPARAEAVALAGGSAQRVRIGPYADRVRAESARLAVATLRRDVTPAVVQNDNAEQAGPSNDADDARAAAAGPASESAPGPTVPVQAAPAIAPAARDVRGWVVQTGAFSQAGEADAQVARFRTAGFAAFVDRLDAPRGTLHRVRIGPEADRAGADRLQASLKQNLGVDGVVMRHP